MGWILGLGCVLLAILSPMAMPAGAADFMVIVNGSNPVVSISARDASNLFLKKTTQWPDGVKAAPVDLDEGAAARESFSKSVHHKSTTAVKSYWQTMIFSGREIPPPEKASAQDVTAFVRANRGAIAYVRAGSGVGGGV
jgi:ABC-type phosphate transport system substrate-binding protein